MPIMFFFLVFLLLFFLNPINKMLQSIALPKDHKVIIKIFYVFKMCEKCETRSFSTYFHIEYEVGNETLSQNYQIFYDNIENFAIKS